MFQKNFKKHTIRVDVFYKKNYGNIKVFDEND